MSETRGERRKRQKLKDRERKIRKAANLRKNGYDFKTPWYLPNSGSFSGMTGKRGK